MTLGESVATASSKPSSAKDSQVLDLIERVGLGLRECLEAALGDVDPNNILQRLMDRRLVKSVQGLPQNRAYYILGREKPLGPLALQQHIALMWHVCMNPGPPCVVLKREELTELFGLQAPAGAHVLEGGSIPRVLHVYAPDTLEVAQGIVRHVERAKSFPKVQKAIDEGSYGFLVLTPWTSGLESKLKQVFASQDLSGVDAGFVGQARKLMPLRDQVQLIAQRVPAPETLTLALKDCART